MPGQTEGRLQGPAANPLPQPQVVTPLQAEGGRHQDELSHAHGSQPAGTSGHPFPGMLFPL